MKKLIKNILIAAAAGTFLAGSAFAADPANEKCPVSKKAVDVDHVVEYTATFCCNKCVGKFEKDPLAYAKKVAEAAEGKCPFSGKDVDESATSAIGIGVCCGKCEKKVTADPAKYLAKLQKAS